MNHSDFGSRVSSGICFLSPPKVQYYPVTEVHTLRCFIKVTNILSLLSLLTVTVTETCYGTLINPLDVEGLYSINDLFEENVPWLEKASSGRLPFGYLYSMQASSCYRGSHASEPVLLARQCRLARNEYQCIISSWVGDGRCGYLQN